MITALVYGGVWTRPGLSRRDRSLITVAIHAALGRAHEMRVHLPTAIRHGCTEQELEEVLIHVGAYAGFPNAAAANAVAQEVFADRSESAGTQAGSE